MGKSPTSSCYTKKGKPRPSKAFGKALPVLDWLYPGIGGQGCNG